MHIYTKLVQYIDICPFMCYYAYVIKKNNFILLLFCTDSWLHR
jgi:hypothetical protein